MPKVLIIDQSKSMRKTLAERLAYEGFTAETAENDAAAAELCGRTAFDLILTDRVASPEPGIPFIVLATDASVAAAMEAVRSGARDYLTKPLDMNRLLQSMRRTLDADETAETAAASPAPARRARRAKPGCSVEMIGSSAEIGRIRTLIEKVAPTEARVLITGENGSGKELVARQLHEQSRRAAGPFVEVNCAAIPSELIESELFGHEKGAFTSAIKLRKGKFEQADGGTLFLDEIGDMSLSAQAKVLRALQERKVTRVGSDRDIDVDVRVVAATNKDLREEILKGNFREDLYHRLAVVVARVPSLRERASDIPQLVDHFLRQIGTEYGAEPKTIAPSAVEALGRMPWTGNIRELRNVVERLTILGGACITLEDVEAYC